MEKVPGRELQDTWYIMTIEERMDVVEKLVDIEKTLFAIRFPANGTLYFIDSLDANVTTVDLPLDASHAGANKFCIGPSTELLWWYQKRDELVNPGSCREPLIYVLFKITND